MLWKGIITIQNPFVSVPRGSDFVLDVVLTPTPGQEVDIVVDSLTSLIVPGSERMVFAVQQSIANEIFYAPRGPVGPAEIVFKSRSLRDYTGPQCNDLSIIVNVQGEISSTLDGDLIGTNVPSLVTVTIDPPASQEVVVDISTYHFGTASPSSIVFAVGEFEKEFNFTTSEFQGQVGCIEFSSTYYQTAKGCFEVTGSFSTNVASQINTFAVETFQLTLSQEQQSDLVVTVTTSDNIHVESPIIVPAFTTVVDFQVDGLTAGLGWIQYSGEHFLTRYEAVEVISIECDSLSTLDVTGLQCLSCPASNELVCASNGVCSFSTEFSQLGRCVCNAEDGAYGPECQFNFLAIDSNLEQHQTNSSLLIDTHLVPSTLQTFFNIPSEVIGVRSYTVYLQGYNGFVYGAVDPTVSHPSISGKVVSVIDAGFILSIVSDDNTEVINLTKPIQLIVNFDSREISQGEFLQTHLFYYDESSQQWLDVTSSCPASNLFADVNTLTYTISICKAGQYQFFRVAPVPAHVFFVSNTVIVEQPQFNDFNAYYVAGATGEAPVVPPQPNFEPQIESTSSGSVLAINILGAFMLVLALLM